MIFAIALHESGFQAELKNPYSSASGYMQLLDSTWGYYTNINRVYYQNTIILFINMVLIIMKKMILFQILQLEYVDINKVRLRRRQIIQMSPFKKLLDIMVRVLKQPHH